MPLRFGRFGLAGLLAWMTVAGLAQPLDGLGDPQRLIIRGAESIETEDVRRAIARNWQIHLASLPTADRGTYLSLLQRLLARGYHRTGFPEAEATAYHDADADAMIVRITEGPRLRTGPVQFVGEAADRIDTGAIITRLTQPLVKPRFFPEINDTGLIRIRRTPNFSQQGGNVPGHQTDRTLWPAGQPAGFDPSRKTRARSAVRIALARQGFFDADFDITTPRIDEQHAALRIKLNSLGLRARLGAVQVVGIENVAAARRLLTPDRGDPINLTDLLAFHEKLWASGRFVRHQVTGIVTNPDTGEVALRVELLPQAHVPLLDADLTDAQQAALRLAHWLNEHAFSSPLLVTVRTRDISAQMLSHPTHGLALRLRPEPAADGDHSPDEVDQTAADDGQAADARLRLRGPISVLARPRELTVIDHASRTRWITRFPFARLIAVVQIAGQPEKPEANGFITFGAGIHSHDPDDAQAPLVITGSADPVALLAHISDAENERTIKDGELIIRSDNAELRCELRTGRLIAWRSSAAGATIHARPADADAWEQAISAQSQAFEQTHTFPPQRAVIGVTRLLTELSINMLREAEPQRGERFGAAAKAIYKLLEGPMIEPFAQRLADASADKTRFNIPGDPQLMARLGMMSLVVGFLPYTDEAFDRGSWPWTITHAAALLSTGMGDRGQAELLRLYRDPDAGPLAMLAAARLLDAIGEHPAAAQFARQGRERLTTDHLAADLQPLILGDRLAPATARRLLASLRTLEPHEAEALAELSEYVTGHPAAAWAEAWRHDRQHPLPTDDPRALARRWLPLLRPPLEAEFNAFAPGPPAPPAAPR